MNHKCLSSKVSAESTLELLPLLKERQALGRASVYELGDVRAKWLKAHIF